MASLVQNLIDAAGGAMVTLDGVARHIDSKGVCEVRDAQAGLACLINSLNLGNFSHNPQTKFKQITNCFFVVREELEQLQWIAGQRVKLFAHRVPSEPREKIDIDTIRCTET